MNILCKLFGHKVDKTRYCVARKSNGKHRWHRNYLMCARCGKCIRTFSMKKEDKNK